EGAAMGTQMRREGRWRVLQEPDWARFAGAGWQGRIMQVEVTDRFSAKQGRSTGRWVLEGAAGRLVVYLKRHYRLPRWLGWLARAWPGGGWSPALREWANLAWARGRGVPVPRAVAAGGGGGAGGGVRGFLAGGGVAGRGAGHESGSQSSRAVEELPGMLPVNEAAPVAGATLPAEGFRRWKRGLAVEMARLAHLLHDRRRFHKDLYLCHFYLRQDDTTTASPA